MSLSKIKLVRIISILFLLLLFSCTKDESPAGPSNIPLQDNTPPSIVSIVPAHLAEDVALETTIILEFSEAIDTMIFDASFIVFTPSIDGTISIDSNMVTYTPSTDLLSNTTYSVSISDQTVDYAGNSMESVYSWEFTTELVIIVEPPSSLRGNYVGIYDLLAFGSGFAGLLGWDSVSWTFTDLSHHAEFIGEYSRFCDYGGTYSIGKELNLTRTTILDQVCDPNEVPEGVFTYQLIVLDNAADTLYFEQTNEANNRRKSIKLVKQE